MTRIAWFTPLPVGAPLKSALTTVAALTEDPAGVEVELFTSTEDLVQLDRQATTSFYGCTISRRGNLLTLEWTARGGERISRQVRVEHFLRAFLRHRAAPFDLFVYQLEDHPRVDFITPQIGLFPGVVYAHDLNLNRLVFSRYRHSTGGTDIQQHAQAAFGKDAPPFGEWHVRGWDFAAFDRAYPFDETTSRDAAVIVVPHRGYLNVISAGSTVDVAVIRPPVIAVGGRTDRVPAPCVIFGGRPDHASRAPAFLDAMTLLADRRSPVEFRWLLADPEDEQTARDLVTAKLGTAPRGQVLVVTDPALREKHISAASSVVATCFDPRRTPTSAALEALACGRPIILTEGVSAEWAPAGTYVSVPVGAGECDGIAAAIEAIADRAAARFNPLAGERGAPFITEILRRSERSRAEIARRQAESEHRLLNARGLLIHRLIQRCDQLDPWGRQDDDSFPDLFSLTARSAVRDFGWLGTADGEGADAFTTDGVE